MIIAATAGAPADINLVSDVPVIQTFTTIGNIRYDCTIHPGMSGTRVVREQGYCSWGPRTGRRVAA